MRNKITILLIIIIGLLLIKNIKSIPKIQNTTATIENNIISSEIEIEEIQFKDISINYEEGITTIKANVYNNTQETKSINVKITLTDENGNVLKSMIQIIENIEPNAKKILQTGAIGDYSTDAKNIQFELVSDDELE